MPMVQCSLPYGLSRADVEAADSGGTLNATCSELIEGHFEHPVAPLQLVITDAERW